MPRSCANFCVNCASASGVVIDVWLAKTASRYSSPSFLLLVSNQRAFTAAVKLQAWNASGKSWRIHGMLYFPAASFRRGLAWAQSGHSISSHSTMATLEWEDMECPDCAHANPLLKEAAGKYNIPWIRHDFPLAFHAWSFTAAVNARWFDTKSKKLGDEYRDAVFANQTSITTPDALAQFTQKFAQERGIQFPFAVDPQGKLAAEVKAD